MLPLALALLSVLAVLKLGIELRRLVADTGYYAAIDLQLRYGEVERWFDGRPVYTELSRVTYPPQAYVMLWPFTGWLDRQATRWLWAATSLLALAWLCWLTVRESGARDRLEGALAVAMVVSMNAVGVTIGNGQLIVHMLPSLVAGLLLLRRPAAGWHTDMAAALLLLFALIKPTLSAPFVWVALMASRRVRPLAITVVGYVLMTLLASSFQPDDVVTLITQWLRQSGAHPGDGNADLHGLLRTLGLSDWSLAGSLLMLAGLGLWTWRRRNVDPWILIGVAAIVARLWSYHRVYDDVLILLPMIALFRIATGRTAAGSTAAGSTAAGSTAGRRLPPEPVAAARVEGAAQPTAGAEPARAWNVDAHHASRGADDDDVVAGLLLAGAVVMMSMPARFLGGAESVMFVTTHLALWFAMLVFLGRRREAVGPAVAYR